MSQIIALTAATMRDENNEVAQSLLAQGYRLRIHSKITFPTREELRELLAGVVGVIAGSEQYSREVLEEATDLRFISRNGVGYDAVDLPAATELGIPVAYVPDAMVDAVADISMALLLAVGRNLVNYNHALKQGEWLRVMSADVSGRTLGLVGTGRIGMATARRARAFRMRLVAYDPYPNPLLVEELGGDYLPLDEVLEVSDFVSLHTPGGAATRALIGTEQLARMKPSAFLINCARGSLVDEEALLAALDAGGIAGAGLDVFGSEPPVPGSASERLARHPRVVGTPHVASFTPVTAARMGRAALENLLTLLRGERPDFLANPEVYDRGLRP